jgi:hypothetical protein
MGLFLMKWLGLMLQHTTTFGGFPGFGMGFGMAKAGVGSLDGYESACFSGPQTLR